jgi:hypothetical protein
MDDAFDTFRSQRVRAANASAARFPERYLCPLCLTDDEFIEVIGDNFVRLPLFTTSAQRMVYRRAIAGLKLSKNNSEDIARLFFKYWVLPRLTSSDVIRVLETYQEKWKHDSSISEFAQSLISNE